jgi:hypothetical protein
MQGARIQAIQSESNWWAMSQLHLHLCCSTSHRPAAWEVALYNAANNTVSIQCACILHPILFVGELIRLSVVRTVYT